ncbi:DUF4259 domain-containing protein [Actinomadura spongiicola]|uniref:DUF4259 domain-containing protein n=2 Tax=Actinomadura spongiicola TaxID=2303421 RepID=A0A372GE53_9ACTN|nr:DUF4259 domain-containing protein [Actinomadura spongiicola]
MTGLVALEVEMGTWGSGPLDSDTAEDYLDELEDQSASHRLSVVKRGCFAGGAGARLYRRAGI